MRDFTTVHRSGGRGGSPPSLAVTAAAAPSARAALRPCHQCDAQHLRRGAALERIAQLECRRAHPRCQAPRNVQPSRTRARAGARRPAVGRMPVAPPGGGGVARRPRRRRRARASRRGGRGRRGSGVGVHVAARRAAPAGAARRRSSAGPRRRRPKDGGGGERHRRHARPLGGRGADVRPVDEALERRRCCQPGRGREGRRRRRRPSRRRRRRGTATAACLARRARFPESVRVSRATCDSLWASLDSPRRRMVPPPSFRRRVVGGGARHRRRPREARSLPVAMRRGKRTPPQPPERSMRRLLRGGDGARGLRVSGPTRGGREQPQRVGGGGGGGRGVGRGAAVRLRHVVVGSWVSCSSVPAYVELDDVHHRKGPPRRRTRERSRSGRGGLSRRPSRRQRGELEPLRPSSGCAISGVLATKSVRGAGNSPRNASCRPRFRRTTAHYRRTTVFRRPAPPPLLPDRRRHARRRAAPRARFLAAGGHAGARGGGRRRGGGGRRLPRLRHAGRDARARQLRRAAPRRRPLLALLPPGERGRALRRARARGRAPWPQRQHRVHGGAAPPL